MTERKTKPKEIKVWVNLEGNLVFFNWNKPPPAKEMRARGYVRATLLLPSRKGKEK
jgi:hypothetical protein